MGYSLRADYTKPLPRPVTLTMRCDGDHGLFDNPVAKFDVTNGDPRAPATAAGWRFDPNGKVFCPSCRSSK